MRLIQFVTCFIFFMSEAFANPTIAFTDLESGPPLGLNDGLGSGAIVTVWGQNFGENIGTVEIIMPDGETYTASHIYYWKKADGLAPGGPANLYESHQMYEVAFSLPRIESKDYPNISSTAGENVSIVITDSLGLSSSGSNFTLREGNIYFIAGGGSNNNPGSFDSPWGYINGAKFDQNAPGDGNSGKLEPGDIVYSMGVVEIGEDLAGNPYPDSGIWTRQLNGTDQMPISFISYPGTPAVASGSNKSIYTYQSSNLVFSKFTLEAGQLVEPPPGSGFVKPQQSTSTAQFKAEKGSRLVGSLLKEREGMCANGYAGAIVSNGTGGSGFQAIGNHILDIGCNATSHFHHTVYMSIRTNTGNKVDPWEFSWNYFQDNKAKNGIHFYDQLSSNSCDGFTENGQIVVSNNYIKNQRGAGIYFTTKSKPVGGELADCWNVDSIVSGNILENVGLGPVAEPENGTNPYAIVIGGHMQGNIIIHNNLVYGVSDDSSVNYPNLEGEGIYNPPAVLRVVSAFNEIQPGSLSASVFNNIFFAQEGMEMISSDSTSLQLFGNAWYYDGFETDDANSKDKYFLGVNDIDIYDALVTKTEGFFDFPIPVLEKNMSQNDFERDIGNLINNTNFNGIFGGSTSTLIVGPLGKISPNPPANLGVSSE